MLFAPRVIYFFSNGILVHGLISYLTGARHRLSVRKVFNNVSVHESGEKAKRRVLVRQPSLVALSLLLDLCFVGSRAHCLVPE